MGFLGLSWVCMETVFVPDLSSPSSEGLAPHLPKTPMKTLKDHGQALNAELRCSPAMALHESTQQILSDKSSNAARQYRRIVSRYAFALTFVHGLESLFVCSGGPLSNKTKAKWLYF